MAADDARPLDIRARIAALELNGSGRARSSSTTSADAGGARGSPRRTTVSIGADPLSATGGEDKLEAFVPLTPSRASVSSRSSSPAPSTASGWTSVSQPPSLPARPALAVRTPSLGSGSLITLDSPQDGASPWIAVQPASPASSRTNGVKPALPPRKPTLPIAAASSVSAAQKRYERVFDGLADRYRSDGRLRPIAVEAIWSRSKLPSDRLASIWCVRTCSHADLTMQGALRRKLARVGPGGVRARHGVDR